MLKKKVRILGQNQTKAGLLMIEPSKAFVKKYKVWKQQWLDQ